MSVEFDILDFTPSEGSLMNGECVLIEDAG